MGKKQTILGVLFLLGLTGICQAEGEHLWHRETMTNSFCGLNDQLADSGIELGFDITSIYQINTHGGISTNERRGRHHSRYEATVDIDLEKLLGIEEGYFYIVCWAGSTVWYCGECVGLELIACRALCWSAHFEAMPRKKFLKKSIKMLTCLNLSRFRRGLYSSLHILLLPLIPILPRMQEVIHKYKFLYY